jgi:hypothetical protein
MFTILVYGFAGDLRAKLQHLALDWVRKSLEQQEEKNRKRNSYLYLNLLLKEKDFIKKKEGLWSMPSI